jgi:hypothetical protein
MAKKRRKRPKAAALDDASTPSRPSAVDPLPSRTSEKDDVPLETYERPAPRAASAEVTRSELSRNPDIQRPSRDDRTARDEP